MQAGAQTPALVMSGLMGSTGSALREELFPCPLCSLGSEQHQACPVPFWGLLLMKGGGINDGVTFAGCDCMFPSTLRGLPAWSAQFLGLVATENVFIGIEKLNLYLLRVWSLLP